ncbi:hypothetical protein WAJ07_20665, partial [Acinetobacter baumannii]
ESIDPVVCEAPASTVWYEVTGAGRRMVVRLQAQGDLDAVVSVFRARRSQLEPRGCDIGDESGAASLDFAAPAGERFLVMVSRRANSQEG